MNRFKKAVAVIILAVSVMVLLAGCSANINVSTRPDNDAPAGSASSDDSMPEEDDALPEEDGNTDEEVPPRDQGIWFMGGLVSDEKGFDMKVAIYRLDGDGVAVVTDGEDIYYGEYETEDTGFDDGTPWTLIKVGGKQFGYYFGDNNDSFIVDNDNNRIKAVDMDEAAGMELFETTDMNDDFEGDISFLEVQSGVREFKDFDDIIAHLEPGQGYAYIKLTGSDDDILVITPLVFEADNSAYEGHLYQMKDGRPFYMGIVTGNGSSYPLRLADGILYGGDNHDYSTYFISSEYGSLMAKDSVSDGIGDGSNEFSGFLRSTNDYDHDEDFTGGTGEFEKLIKEREKKPVIVFTTVK